MPKTRKPKVNRPQEVQSAKDLMMVGEFQHMKSALDRGILDEREFFFFEETYLVSKDPESPWFENGKILLQVDCIAKWLIEFEDHGYSNPKAESMMEELRQMINPLYSSGFPDYFFSTSFGLGYVRERSVAASVCNWIFKDPCFSPEFLFDTGAVGLTRIPLSDNPALPIYFMERDRNLEEYLWEIYDRLETSHKGKVDTFSLEDILTFLHHRCATFPEFRPIAANLLQEYLDSCLRISSLSSSAPKIPSIKKCCQSSEAEDEKWKQEIMEWRDSIVTEYSMSMTNDSNNFVFHDNDLFISYVRAVSAVTILLFSSISSGEWTSKQENDSPVKSHLLPQNFFGVKFLPSGGIDIFAHSLLCSEFISKAAKAMQLDPGPLFLKQLIS